MHKLWGIFPSLYTCIYNYLESHSLVLHIATLCQQLRQSLLCNKKMWRYRRHQVSLPGRMMKKCNDLIARFVETHFYAFVYLHFYHSVKPQRDIIWTTALKLVTAGQTTASIQLIQWATALGPGRLSPSTGRRKWFITRCKLAPKKWLGMTTGSRTGLF